MGQIQKLVDRYYAWNWGNQPQPVKETKERVLTEEEVKEVKKTVKLIWERLENFNKVKRLEREKEIKEVNQVCTHCQSRNVNDRIKNTEGDINASASSYGSFLPASVSGKIRTYAVNKCNDCNHEWKKEKEEKFYPYNSDFVTDRLRNWLENWSGVKKIQFDPLDTTEEYFSLEEKIKDKTSCLEESSWIPLMKEIFEGVDYSLLFYIVKQLLTPYDFREVRWRDISNNTTGLAAEKARLILKMK